MKNLEAITSELKAPLPCEAIKPHPTKSFLSTINPIYVIERLNEVFGLDGWHFTSEVLKEKDKWVVVKGTLHFTVGDHFHKIEQYGGNDNPDLGDAYKGAATDALTKCASYIGIGADVWKSKSNEKPQDQEWKKIKEQCELMTTVEELESYFKSLDKKEQKSALIIRLFTNRKTQLKK